MCCLEKVHVQKARMRPMCKGGAERAILWIWDPAVLEPEAPWDFLVVGVNKGPFTSAM